MWNPVIALHHCAIERGNSGRVVGNSEVELPRQKSAVQRLSTFHSASIKVAVLRTGDTVSILGALRSCGSMTRS
jgi:hypothetical protein